MLFLDPDGTVRTIADGVEEIPFPEAEIPRVDPQWPTAVVDFSADSSHLFVLFAGLTEEKRRIVGCVFRRGRRIHGLVPVSGSHHGVGDPVGWQAGHA